MHMFNPAYCIAQKIRKERKLCALLNDTAGFLYVSEVAEVNVPGLMGLIKYSGKNKN